MVVGVCSVGGQIFLNQNNIEINLASVKYIGSKNARFVLDGLLENSDFKGDY